MCGLQPPSRRRSRQPGNHRQRPHDSKRLVDSCQKVSAPQPASRVLYIPDSNWTWIAARDSRPHLFAFCSVIMLQKGLKLHRNKGLREEAGSDAVNLVTPCLPDSMPCSRAYCAVTGTTHQSKPTQYLCDCDTPQAGWRETVAASYAQDGKSPPALRTTPDGAVRGALGDSTVIHKIVPL